MSQSTLVSIHCDGCANGPRNVVTVKTIFAGPPTVTRIWARSAVLKDLGWKQFPTRGVHPRRDYCPDCVAKGLAK